MTAAFKRIEFGLEAARFSCAPSNDNAHHIVLIEWYDVPQSGSFFPHARAASASTREGEAQLAQGQRPEQAGGWGLIFNWYDPTGFAGEGVEEEVIVHGDPYAGYTDLPGYWNFGGAEPNLIFQSVPPNADGDAARQQRLEDAYYGAGQYSSLHGSIPGFSQVEDTSPTWNAIGAYGTMALNVVNAFQGARALVTTAWRAVAGRVAAPNAGRGARRLLARSESSGGHLIARHVGLDAAALDARIATGNVNLASSFSSLAEAKGALAAALGQDRVAVSAWVQMGATGRLTVSTPFSGGVVRVLGGNSAVASGARFVLQGNGAGGYHLLTGFPIP